MLLDAPLRDDLLRRPRFAAKAAPAAICCFFDFAGMTKSRTEPTGMQRGYYPRLAQTPESQDQESGFEVTAVWKHAGWRLRMISYAKFVVVTGL